MDFVGRRGEATLSLWPSEGSFSVGAFSEFASALGIFLADYPIVDLAPGESMTLTRNLTVAADTARSEGARWAAQGREVAPVSGSVFEPGAVPVAGARVHLVSSDGQVGAFAITDASGDFSAALPPGDWTAWVVAGADEEQVDLPAGAGRYGPWAAESVNAAQLSALTGSSWPRPLDYAVGRAVSEPEDFSLGSDGASLSLSLEPASALHVDLVDDSGAPLPGVIELRWSDGAPPPSTVPDALREALGIPGGARAAWGWTADGGVTLAAAPGTYDVIAGHSWRHERQTAAGVRVEAGETAAVRLQLAEVVPRDGWLALDPHLHGAPSFDGALPMEDRLVTCAATGVELPVTTDHDAVAEYRGLAEALGLSGRLQVVPGVEVSTLLRGHFNLYPIEPQPIEQLNGGAVPWWDGDESTQALFDRMREMAGPDAIIQVNHPRTPGMFAFAGYDPQTGEPDDPELWSWDFETFELLNGGVDDLSAMREDWFSLLNRGEIRVPVGVSDSHYRYIPCGLGRTDLYLGTTDPAAVSPAQIRAALAAGHVVVASGVTLRASLDGALPGDTITKEKVSLTATVSAPSWVVPGTLRVYQDGQIIHELSLPDDVSGGYEVSWPVAVDRDAWIVVEVEGEVSLGDSWRGSTAYAATNAFFLDVDGEGWVAPG